MKAPQTLLHARLLAKQTDTAFVASKSATTAATDKRK